MSQSVTIYFDFISPYAYLGLTQTPAFFERNELEPVVRPVVYAALLDHHGLVGPAETAAKRRYTFNDVARAAHLLGVAMVGPPAHPFRSLEALRIVCAFHDQDDPLGLALALAHEAWGAGRDLADPEVRRSVVERRGLPSQDLEDRLKSDEVKGRLRRYTEEAIEAGVFGVPTFRWNDELFWGHDRMAHLEARLKGRVPAMTDRAESILARPRAVERAGSPHRDR